MIFIIGGAYQGKKDYAQKIYNLIESDYADGDNCGFDEVFSKKCIFNYHNLIRRMTESNTDAVCFTQRLCMENQNSVIIMNEIGCGIVPVDKCERIWRETVGKCGCIIAENSSEVIRIINSIPVVIKG